MKRIGYLFFVFTILLIYVDTLWATITASPSSFSIPRGLEATKRITYSITTPGCTSAVSNSGTFISGQTILGLVNTTVSTNLTGSTNLTTGTASETLIIPIRVIKKAEQLGVNRFDFRRQFQYNCAPGVIYESVSVTTTLTSEAAAELSITRLQLYFENRRAEITVKRNQPSLKAYADLRFTGSGYLRGYWEVDGRILSYVNRHLVYGRSVTLETPEVPPLPTFVTGTHILKFVITSPSVELPMPEAIYFVTAEEFGKAFSINLISPKDGAEIDYSPQIFRWEGRDQKVTYLIEFLEEGNGKPTFSAYTKRFDYTLPPSVLKTIFLPGRRYFWRVKGFDSENNVIGESPAFHFTFKEAASHLPGQILIATELSPKGMDLIQRISQKYNLGLIETYDLKSINLKVVIFQTKEEIFRLIQAIIREEGVMLAQPNYIFRTMAEPMSDMQNVYRILHLKRLHERYKGKGVVVAVVDTGVDTNHRDLKDRIAYSANLLKDYPYIAEIHGTAVAGVIGATINGFGIEGVAPEVEIVALKACRQVSETHPEGECYTSSVAKAIDMAIERRVKIVNMSFGSISRDRLVTRLIEEGSRRGIVFVAPAGNMPRQKELLFPASHPDVIAVGGMDDAGNPYPNQEIASKAKVCGPATNVLTTIPGDKHNFITGTSMASASIAGILAIAAEKDGTVNRERIPPFKGDVCQWEEELLRMPVCGK
ncbi:MAG: S8 family serine peptidase [Syntrophaceae bacterium]|nr:S8 family serine peptidase [Syntrophaceae bacterium]